MPPAGLSVEGEEVHTRWMWLELGINCHGQSRHSGEEQWQRSRSSCDAARVMQMERAAARCEKLAEGGLCESAPKTFFCICNKFIALFLVPQLADQSMNVENISRCRLRNLEKTVGIVNILACTIFTVWIYFCHCFTHYKHNISLLPMGHDSQFNFESWFEVGIISGFVGETGNS